MAEIDALQGLQILRDSINDIAVSRTIQGANAQANQIRQAELGEEEQQQALNQLQADAVANLSALGAPQQRVQQALFGITGPQASPIQSAIQGLTDPSEEVRTRTLGALRTQAGFKEALGQQELEQRQQLQTQAEDARKEITKLNLGADLQRQLFDITAKATFQEKAIESREKIAGAKTTAAAGTAERKEEIRTSDLFLKQADKFEKGGSKPLIENINAIASMEAALNTGTVPGLELSKIGLVKLSGESGRLSDQDINRAAFDVSVARKMQSFFKKALLGEPLNATKEDMLNFVKVLKIANERTLRENAASFAKSLEATPGTGIKAKEFESILLDRIGVGSAAQGQIRKRRLKDGTVVRVQEQFDGSFVEVR